VNIEVRDGTGAVLSAGTRTFAINNTVTPANSLKGSLSMDKQSLLSGEAVTAAFGVTNTGAGDIQDIGWSVAIVNAADQMVYDSLSSQATLSTGMSYTRTWQIDTLNYTAKDYLVVLRASINGGPEETIAGTYFRVEGARQSRRSLPLRTTATSRPCCRPDREQCLRSQRR